MTSRVEFAGRMWDLPAFMADLLGSRDPHIQFVVRLGVTLVVILITVALSRFARSRFRSWLVRGGLQVNVAFLLARVLWIGVWVLGIGAVLYVLGVGLTPFAALIGVIGLAASLAFQQVLQNLVAGIYLLAERPFHIGDLIAVVGPAGANHEGTVEDIQMRTTYLRNRDDELILVPNSAIFSGVVTNRTAVGGHASHITVTFPRSTDLDVVRQEVVPLLEKVAGVLSDPPPRLRLDTVGKEDWTASLIFWGSGDMAALDVIWSIACVFPNATVNNGSGE